MYTPAATAVRRNSARRKPSEDTIEVKQKPVTAKIVEAVEDATLPDVSTTPQRGATVTRTSNRPWGRKGKAPVQEPKEPDEDYVEEYDFSDEDIIEDEDEFDDDKSVITLSSESSEDSEEGLTDRPWKTFDFALRRQWETMYATLTDAPIGGNWEVTEDYQEKKDGEMVRYLEDFPLQEWVIPKEQADQAYFRLLERTRWRQLGIRIYGRERIPEWIPGATHASQMQKALNPPRDSYPRNASGEPMRYMQPAPVQDHAQQRMPPPALPGHVHGYGPMTNPTRAGMPSGSFPPPPHGLPTQHTHHTGLGVGYHQELARARRAREEKKTPVPTTPPLPPPTPPYEARQRPNDKKATKIGRRSARRQIEADEFPWTRKLNFPVEKIKSDWDDGVYDRATLEEMDAIRTRNVPVIDELDAKVQEQQRMARQAKKNREKIGESSEVEGDGNGKEKKKKKKMQRGQRKGESGGDPYHSGAFAFATFQDEQRAALFGFKTPDDILDAAEAGGVKAAVQASIKICWNPGKKGTTENLEQVKFSVRDTIVTRKQLDETRILTYRAAECVIDFCPDMLWRGMLLRICSEAGMGNKDVRDRFCYNGCYCDKATITKRISAALGQKQVQPKSKGYGPGEWEWYDGNVKDFAKYIEYFGKRISHRNMLKIQMQGEKRKLQDPFPRADMAESSADEGPSKRRGVDGDHANVEGGSGGSSSSNDNNNHHNHTSNLTVIRQADDDGGGGGGGGGDDDHEDAGADDQDGHESDASDDSNAVSIQDSDILDKMEED